MTLPYHSCSATAGSSVSFTRTQLASTAATYASTNLVSTSLTPSNNSLLVAIVQGTTNGTGNYNANVSGGGLTWTRQLYKSTSIGSNYYVWGEIWTAPLSTVASMTVTLANTLSQEYIAMAVFQYTGANASPIGTSQSGAFGGNVTPSLTLPAAPLASSEVIAAINANTHTGATLVGSNGTGWTEVIGEQYWQYDGREIEARSGSTSTSVTWSKSINSYGIIATALEIKSA